MEKTTSAMHKEGIGEEGLDIYAGRPGLAYRLIKGFNWKPVISFFVLAAAWQVASLFNPLCSIAGDHLTGKNLF